MRLNSYIRFIKFFLVLAFSSVALVSCVCKPDATVNVNNKNAQIYVLNFSDSAVSLSIGDEAFSVNPDTTRKYYVFSDYYSEECSECGNVHLIDGYFFAYSYNKDFLYLLSDSDKFFTAENNLETKTEIVLRTSEETLFQSELLQDVETSFNCSYEVVYEDFSLQDGAYLENGNFLFATKQESNPNVKIIVHWTSQDNYVFTSPIYLIIVPPKE